MFIGYLCLVTMTFKLFKTTHCKKSIVRNNLHTHHTHNTKLSFTKQYFFLPYDMHSYIFFSNFILFIYKMLDETH